MLMKYVLYFTPYRVADAVQIRYKRNLSLKSPAPPIASLFPQMTEKSDSIRLALAKIAILEQHARLNNLFIAKTLNDAKTFVQSIV